MALWRLGDHVGGVGGVGGLTNQFSCNTTDADPKAPYCFYPGWLGLTPFGCAMLLLCTVPLGVAALTAHYAAPGRKDPEQEVATNEQEVKYNELVVPAISLLGGGASALWFLVPFASYTSDPFFTQDAWHILLAISIAAAFPLSWHMSFVAIPSTGAPYLSRLLGLSPVTLKAGHKRAAWATLFWAGVHGVGEIIFLESQGNLGRLSPRSPGDGGNLTFFFGLMSFSIMIVLATHVISRHRVAIPFRGVHRVLAYMVLLMASAHWWPFALLLAPAVACAATGCALGSSSYVDADDGKSALALIAALVTTLLGIVFVWALRQSWMLAHPYDYYTWGVYMFPPAAVSVAFVFSRLAAAAVFKATSPATRALPAAALLGANSASAA